MSIGMTSGLGRWLVTLSLATTMGCGGSDDEGTDTASGSLSEATALSYEGVYELTLLTENSASCDGPGQELTSTSDPYFLAVASQIFGQWLVDLYACLDVADCQSKADAARARMGGITIGYGATLSEEETADELTGFTSWTGFEMEGTCVDREYDGYRLTRAGDTLRLEGMTKALADRPAEDGICWARPEQDAGEAASAPCVASRVVEGTRVSDL